MGEWVREEEVGERERERAAKLSVKDSGDVRKPCSVCAVSGSCRRFPAAPSERLSSVSCGRSIIMDHRNLAQPE